LLKTKNEEQKRKKKKITRRISKQISVEKQNTRADPEILAGGSGAELRPPDAQKSEGGDPIANDF